MRPALALVVLAACGRIGFDSFSGGGGGGGGGDAGRDSRVSDTPADAPADAASLCTPFDHTYAASNFGVAGLAWMGSQYAILTIDGLATISETGALGAFTPLSPAPTTSGAGQNGIAWGANELAVIWVASGGRVEAQLFDSTLAPINTPQTLEPLGMDRAHIAYADTGFVATWHVASGELGIAEVSTSGSVVAGPYGTTSSGAITDTQSVVAINGSYLVGYYQAGGIPGLIAFNKPLDGNASGPTITLGASQVTYLQLANVPSGAVILQAAGTGAGTGYAQILGAGGVATSGMIALPTDGGNVMNFATAVATGGAPIIAGITGAAPAQIVTAQLDIGGAAFGPLHEVATQAVSAYGPVAAAHAPGRLLLAIPYSDMGGATSHTRLIHICN